MGERDELGESINDLFTSVSTMIKSELQVPLFILFPISFTCSPLLVSVYNYILYNACFEICTDRILELSIFVPQIGEVELLILYSRRLYVYLHNSDIGTTRILVCYVKVAKNVNFSYEFTFRSIYCFTGYIGSLI